MPRVNINALSIPAISGLINDFNFGNLPSVTFDVNGVSQIVDGVSSLASAQATNANKPAYNTSGGLKNLPYASFRGSQFLSGGLLGAVDTATIFVLMRQNSGGSEQGVIQNGNDSVNGYGLTAMAWNGTNTAPYCNSIYLPGLGDAVAPLPCFADNRWKVVSMTADRTLSVDPYCHLYDLLTSEYVIQSASKPNQPTTKHTIGGGFLQAKFNGDIQRILVYNRALSQAEVQTISNWMLQYYLIPMPKHFICMGDSITAPDFYSVGNYPEVIFYGAMPTSPYYSFSNKGISGDTTGGCLQRFQKDILNQYNPIAKNIFTLAIGHNGPGTGGSGDAYTDILNMCNQAYNLGFKVIVCTVLNATALNYSALNTAIRNMCASNPFTLCDIQAIPQLANPADLTYFRDGTHPTVAGLTLIANLLQPVIDSL